jgi:hypothetical protein
MVLVLGQSNAVGRAEVQRLQNATHNPAGYTREPGHAFIYDKGNYAKPDLMTDDGTWRPYFAGVNSSTDGSPLDHFGPELALSQKINKATGNDVYIVKAAFGATALSPGITTERPGNWTETTGQIAIDAYLKRAVRDLKAAHPNVQIEFRGVVWWQGENDAAYGIAGPDYGSRLTALRARFDADLTALFGAAPPWLLVGLNFHQSPGEAGINSSLCLIAQANPKAVFISTMRYPRKLDLTADQKAPIQAGSQDDNHASYITQLAVGERAADAFVNGNLADEGC